MSKRLVYFIFGILAVCTRFYFESQSTIVSGINGGYIPVQVLKIYEHGYLAINDMPLVFYANALIVKLIVYFFPSYSVKLIVVFVVKVLGAISMPLILFPLYKINHKLIKHKLPVFFEYSIVMFCLFSFSSLYLGAEMMKNAFGLVGFTFFIYFLFQLLNKNSTKYKLLMGLVLILIGFTHFGVFSISIILLIISLICVFKKRAIFPILVTSVVGFLMVWIFDSTRALNAINIFDKWFGLPWRIAYYFPGIINSIVNLGIAILLFFTLKNSTLSKIQRQLFTILLIFIVLLALPILRFELWRRFSFMLFVPQAIALVLVFPYLKDSFKTNIPLFITVICCVALTYNFISPKKAVISAAAYNDLSSISNKISNPEKTLIIARHGLEWWMIWQLNVKMAQPHFKIDEQTMAEYDEILILRQKKGKNKLYPGPYSPFEIPTVSNNNSVLYSSDYFDVFRRSND